MLYFPRERYFFEEADFAGLVAFFLTAARRSFFWRRAARFLTLSRPWLFPIRLHLRASDHHSQAVSSRFRANLCLIYMARPNYSGEKRRKELEKQRKKEEKKRRKLENTSSSAIGEASSSIDAGDQPAVQSLS